MLHVSNRKAKKRGSLSGLFSLFRNDNEAEQHSASPLVGSSGARHLDSISSQLEVVGAEDHYRDLVSLEHSGEHLQERLIESIERIALEASEYGAREVFIGHPREYRYEFFVDDRGYQGSLPQAEFSLMLKLFSEDTELSFPLEWPEADQLFLSLTNNYLNPVIHVSWRMRWLDSYITETEDGLLL